MNPSQSQPEQSKSPQGFDEWAEANGYYLERNLSGKYAFVRTDAAQDAWNARQSEIHALRDQLAAENIRKIDAEAKLEAQEKRIGRYRQALKDADSTLCDCRYHAAHRIIRAALAGEG